MKIIKQGTLPERPEDTTHKELCGVCKSRIEFNISEIKPVDANDAYINISEIKPVDANDAYINCPFCNQIIDLESKLRYEWDSYMARLSLFYRTHPRIADIEGWRE